MERDGMEWKGKTREMNEDGRRRKVKGREGNGKGWAGPGRSVDNEGKGGREKHWTGMMAGKRWKEGDGEKEG